MKKNARPKKSAERDNSLNNSSRKCDSKEMVVLKVLLRRSLNRFEAEKIGDHCLHSTVSTLRHANGIDIDRVWETVPTRFGRATRVKRYRVALSGRMAAHRRIAACQTRRRRA